MKNKNFAILLTLFLVITVFMWSILTLSLPIEYEKTPQDITIVPIESSKNEDEASSRNPIVPEPKSDFEDEIILSDEEVDLIALCTMAEAEGECEEGKRLVIDTILNRVDSSHFPDTVYNVIYQPYQFTSMWNGRVDRCEVRRDICELVREELKSRTNYDVVFFMSGGYSKYGNPLFRVENHYFSSYD